MHVARSGLSDGTPLALIGHPNGIPMKIDTGGVVTFSSTGARWLADGRDDTGTWVRHPLGWTEGQRSDAASCGLFQGGVYFLAPGVGQILKFPDEKMDELPEQWAELEASAQLTGARDMVIDGTIYANTRTDCFFEPLFGGLTNCYGLRRLDIERAFPEVRDSPHAGFRFVLDIGALIEFGYVEGFHVLSIRSGDVNANSSEFAEVPVTFICDDRVGNEGAFGDIDLPPDGLLFEGVVPFTGWALDFEGVDRVQIFVDGAPAGDAVYGLPRPGISAAFPGFPDSLLPGWSFSLNTTVLENGNHQLQVIVTDDDGFTTMIAERTFHVENP